MHNDKALPALASLPAIVGLVEQVMRRRHHPVAHALPVYLWHLMQESPRRGEQAMCIDAAHAKRAGASSLPAGDQLLWCSFLHTKNRPQQKYVDERLFSIAIQMGELV
jgi:hypothetical protein